MAYIREGNGSFYVDIYLAVAYVNGARNGTNVGDIMAGEIKRVRLTEESIANIGVATTATATAAKGNGGYTVTVANQWGSEVLQNGNGPATYGTLAAAKKAVERHNPNIEFGKQEVLPSPSMRPPHSK